MRLLAVLLAAYMLAAVQPAWAYLETLPGDPEWPEIPDRAGIKAFLGTWMPQCNKGAILSDGDMTIHKEGQVSYKRAEAGRYRVIEETPYYVIALVREPSFRPRKVNVTLWALRPLGKSFRPRGHTDMSTMGVNYCHVDADVARAEAIWGFTDAELVEFWKNNSCHPSRTEKHDIDPYWGEGWGQYCYYARSR